MNPEDRIVKKHRVGVGARHRRNAMTGLVCVFGCGILLSPICHAEDDERKFVVLDSTGAPIRNAELVFREGPGTHSGDFKTGTDGTFSMDTMSFSLADPEAVVISKKGYVTGNYAWPTKWPATATLMRVGERPPSKKKSAFQKATIQQITYTIAARSSSSDLTFKADGTMRYRAKNGTDNDGANKNVDDTVQLDPNAFRELAEELQAGRFGALASKYTVDNEEFMVSDASTYTMNVVFTDRAGKESSKTVSIYGIDSSPPLLRKVARKMEKLYPKGTLDIWQ